MLIPTQNLPAAPGSAFNQGTAAYRAGRYAQALRSFREAQDAGDTSDQLLYNIGVTCYRLRDFARASTSFDQLARRPRLVSLAHYNLGLIALKTGDVQRAQAEFAQSRNAATEPALRSLAERQLARLGVPLEPGPDRIGFLRLAGGYDDNVTLADPSVVEPSLRSSPVAVVLVGGRTALTGDLHQGLQLSGAAFGVTYADAPGYDFAVVRAGPQYRIRSGSLSGEIGATGAHLSLGGSTLQTMGTLRLRTSHKASRRQRLSASYEFDWIVGGDRFDYLDGWRQTVRLSDRWENARFSVVGGYRLELNQRRDLERAGEFFSASPTRHRGFAKARWRFASAADATLEVQYERSRFEDPDRTTGSAPVTRQDGKRLGGLQVSWHVAPGWEVAVAYRYLDRPSNIPIREYSSNRAELRLQYGLP